MQDKYKLNNHKNLYYNQNKGKRQHVKINQIN